MLHVKRKYGGKELQLNCVNESREVGIDDILMYTASPFCSGRITIISSLTCIHNHCVSRRVESPSKELSLERSCMRRLEKVVWCVACGWDFFVVEVFEPPGHCENTDIAGAGTLRS
jgi:hypothetical protein